MKSISQKDLDNRVGRGAKVRHKLVPVEKIDVPPPVVMPPASDTISREMAIQSAALMGSVKSVVDAMKDMDKTRPKRLTIHRDNDGLISHIDIEAT